MSPYVFRRRKPHKVTAPAGADGPDDITCADCNFATVQAAVDAAVDGNIIGIPAGTCTWADSVVISNKNLYLRGAGIGSTVINGSAATPPPFIFFCSVSDASKGAIRLSHMTWGGTIGNDAVKFSNSISPGAIPAGKFRVHNIHFNFPTKFNRHYLGGGGPWFGLLDHNTHDTLGGIMLQHQWAIPSEDTSGGAATYTGNFANAIATGFGSENFVVCEDSTLEMHNTASTAFLYDASAGGGRIVLRYLTLNGPMEVYNHWVRNKEVCASVVEVYNNTWNVGSGGDPGDGLMRLESGTGVFYNNAVIGWHSGSPYITLDDRRAGGFGGLVGAEGDFFGDCDGTNAWDGNAGDPSAPGWPCMNQPGRGYTSTTSIVNLMAGTVEQPSEPFYLWNNGTQAGCATGGACTDSIQAFVDPAAYIKKTAHAVNGEVDYVESNTAKPGYTAYTYPHPVQSVTWP